MTEFTPILSSLGGLLIGLSAAGTWFILGRIAGISGIAGGLFTRHDVTERYWRAAFILGLLCGGAILFQCMPDAFINTVSIPTPLLIFAGLSVGIGTRLGGGCTSGHGICGLSRGSFRSLVAVLLFMSSGIITAVIAAQWGIYS